METKVYNRMGQTQSVQIDPRHIGIYRKLLAIQNPHTRLEMIDTILGDPNIVYSAKVSGVYSSLLQYSSAIRYGRTPPPLFGEQPTGKVLEPPQIQQRPIQGTQTAQTLQYHPQAFQVVQHSNQLVPTVQSNNDYYKQVSKPKKSEKALNFFSACLRVLNIQEEVALTSEALKAAYKKAVPFSILYYFLRFAMN
jgi:hypothetical protein